MILRDREVVKHEFIRGYEILEPFRISGTASWSIAQKDGVRYFIKRFNTPKRSEAMIRLCDEFESRKNRMHQKLSEINRGNLVFAKDFFCENQIYYIITEYFPPNVTSSATVYSLPVESRKVIIKSLIFLMKSLESVGIIHADMKPTNVMLKHTVGDFYALKLIDFDSSYFTDDVPKDSDSVEGDPAYMAPEVLKCICGEDVFLTARVDVFSVGIMLHEYLSGEMPGFDHENYNYLCESVADGQKASLSVKIEEPYYTIIEKMLSENPEERPSFELIFDLINGSANKKDKPKEEETSEAPVITSESKPADRMRDYRDKKVPPFMKRSTDL